MLKNLIEKSFYQNRELNQLTFTRLKKNIINGSSILKKKNLKKKKYIYHWSFRKRGWKSKEILRSKNDNSI